MRSIAAAVAALLVTEALLVALAASGAAQAHRPLEFRGRVVIPPEAVLRGKRITLTLLHVGTSFHARTLSNFKGEFRFKEVPPGVYSLSILIPGAGEMRTTVDITEAFADEKERVEKEFVYDADALAHESFPLRQGIVSVRELSIPRKARREYSAARDDLRNQKVESARRHLEKAVEIAPQFLEALNYLGVLAYQQKDFATAAEYFRKALEVDADAYEPLVNLGGALLGLGNAQQALEVNQRAQEAQPRDALANSQLGLTHYLLGNDEDALNYLLLAKQMDPAHFSNPQLPLANIYLRNSAADAAIEELEEFLRLHPDSQEAESVQAMINRIRRQEAENAAAVGR